MANIEIDGKQIEAQDGAMVIEAADAAGIPIPRFCYHKKLSIAANCRMCLVEVEKVAKPLPACATPVTDGMVVHTRSPKAIAAQKAVMEFLLINHPLDCPICDQGGECDLQEMAMGYGRDVSRYSEGKRVVADKNIGPLIATDMTRCIHCTRCVRFGQEVAGIMEMGALGRGEHMRITTYLAHGIESELSGNMIDLCPVGALTSKPYRYTARPWELKRCASVSPHDCVGANLDVHTRSGKVMRVIPWDNEEVNETWLADRDRFAYVGLKHGQRLTVPKIKRDGQWQEADWDTALTFAAEGLKRVLAQHGAGRLGALGAYTATTEELFLLQKLMRGVGSGNIDHRLRQVDFRDQGQQPPFPWLGQSIPELEQLDAALLVGSNIRMEQPLLSQRLRKAALNNGARLMAVNAVDYDFIFPLEHKRIAAPAEMVGELAAIARAAVELSGQSAPEGFNTFSSGVEVTDAHRAMAQVLVDAESGSVLVGNGAFMHADQSVLRALAGVLAQVTGCRLGYLPEGGNSAGAALAGALPHRQAGGMPAEVEGVHWRQMIADDMKGWLLLGLEAELDCIDGAAIDVGLGGAEFVLSLTAFETDAMERYADVMLPINLYPETSGTFVNLEGRWQSFAGCAVAPGESRPAWKILRVMGNLLDVDGFDYLSPEEVREELQAACEGIEETNSQEWSFPAALSGASEGLTRIAEYPIYAVDPLVRRSAPLQAAPTGWANAAYVHPATAAALGLEGAAAVLARQGSLHSELPLRISERVPENCVWIPVGHAESMGGTTESDTVVLERIPE